MKKNFFFLIITTIISITLISCGNSNSKSDAPNTESNSTTQETEKESNDKNDKIQNDSGSNFQNDSNTIKDSSENKSKTKNLRIYYYDIEKKSIIYEEQSLQINDGAIVNAIINAYKCCQDNPNLSGLPDTVSVKSAKLEKDKDLLSINFGDTFINTLGYDQNTEKNILQSIINSLGYNLNVSKIYITVSDKPYSSEYITETEPFNVNLK